MLIANHLSASSIGRPSCSESNDRALAFFRIGIALAILAKCAEFLPFLDLLYGEYGVVQKPIAEAFSNPNIPTAFTIAKLLNGSGFDSPPVYETLFLLNGIAGVGLLVGASCRL